jgi:amino-acid N-acetyltransferase
MTGGSRITLRRGRVSQAVRIHALIVANQREGRLLPRSRDEVRAHADRFVVALRGRRVVGCAELAPLGGRLAEVRSLAVDDSVRGQGVGARLVEELQRRARREGFDRICAFAHIPEYFAAMGFSMVPHHWVPEKVSSDCVACPHLGRCGQAAMIAVLEPAAVGVDPAAATAERYA